jgi:hypothetical protein
MNDKRKSLPFDREALDSLPAHIKAKIKSENRETANFKSKNRIKHFRNGRIKD